MGSRFPRSSSWQAYPFVGAVPSPCGVLAPWWRSWRFSCSDGHRPNGGESGSVEPGSGDSIVRKMGRVGKNVAAGVIFQHGFLRCTM